MPVIHGQFIQYLTSRGELRSLIKASRATLKSHTTLVSNDYVMTHAHNGERHSTNEYNLVLFQFAQMCLHCTVFIAFSYCSQFWKGKKTKSWFYWAIWEQCYLNMNAFQMWGSCFVTKDEFIILRRGMVKISENSECPSTSEYFLGDLIDQS